MKLKLVAKMKGVGHPDRADRHVGAGHRAVGKLDRDAAAGKRRRAGLRRRPTHGALPLAAARLRGGDEQRSEDDQPGGTSAPAPATRMIAHAAPRGSLASAGIGRAGVGCAGSWRR